MKVSGKKLEALAIGEVSLPREGGPLVFKIRATSLGDESKGDRLFPDVRPPSEWVLDKNRQPVRDPDTKKPMRETNYYDPGYVKAQEEAAKMQMVVTVVDCLAADPNVVWENEKTRDSKDFYETCFEEMQAAGLTLGDIRIILQKARELGNLDGKKLEEAASSF